MPECDRTAVDVDLVLVDAEIAHGLDANAGERLVYLDEVEVGRRDAFARARLRDRCRWLGLQTRIGAGAASVRADRGQPGQAELLGLRLAHDHDSRRSVGDLR